MAAIAAASGEALADHGDPYHDDTTDVKFCFKVDANASNTGLTKRDNWLKTKVLAKKCMGCSMKQVENIHTPNGNNRGTWKCGPTRTVDTPNYWGNESQSGKIVLDYGPDLMFDAHGAGPFCFVGYTVSGNLVNPWKVEQGSGC